MGADAIRLTVVMTHPVQYYAPWFRHLAAHHPELDLTVLYAIRPTAEQQGVGFGRAFTWDVPLTEGYPCRVVESEPPGGNVDGDFFHRLDVRGIVPALEESEPDVALIPGWYSRTLLRALWACRRRGIPALYRGDTHRGNAPAGWRRPAWAVKTWLLLRQFRGFLSVGKRVREHLLRFGVRAESIFDAPHCVDNAYFADRAAAYQTPHGRVAARTSFGLPANDFVVLFAGKLEAKKRPQDVLRAAARLGPGASVLVAGTGPLEEACRATAGQLGVRVAWAGFLNQSEIGRAYAAADCLVLPSAWGETWGLVVNEALATGLPCVVSDQVGCAPDLIEDGETGYQYPMGQVDALATALRRVRSGRHWGDGCRARVAAYSLEAASAGLVAACRAVGRRRAVHR